MPPGEQPQRIGLATPLPAMLPGPMPVPADQPKVSVCQRYAGPPPATHTHVFWLHTGEGSPALLSKTAADCGPSAARVQRITMPPCKPAVAHKKGEGPIKFTDWDQKRIACSQGMQECAVRSGYVWEFSLGRDKQRLVHVHGDMEIAATPLPCSGASYLFSEGKCAKAPGWGIGRAPGARGCLGRLQGRTSPPSVRISVLTWLFAWGAAQLSQQEGRGKRKAEG